MSQRRNPVAYFLAGFAAFSLVGWIPGPQGAGPQGAATFDGDLNGSVLTDTAGGDVVIQAAATQATKINDPGGSTLVLFGTDSVEFAGQLATSTGDLEFNPDGDVAIKGGRDLLLEDDGKLIYGTGGDWAAQAESGSLTDNVATTIFSISTSDDNAYGGTIEYLILVDEDAGTHLQAESGQVEFVLIDRAGGVTAGINETADTAQATSTGTLTTTWTMVTTDDGSIEVQVNANTSLSSATFTIYWWVSGSNLTITVP